MNPVSPYHLEPDGDAWRLYLGPFRDKGLAEAAIACLIEISRDVNLLELASVPPAILRAVIEAERDLQKGATRADLAVLAGPEGERKVEYRPMRSFRSAGRKKTKNS